MDHKTFLKKFFLSILIGLTASAFFLFYEVSAPEIAFRLSPPEVQEIRAEVFEEIQKDDNQKITSNRLIIPAIGFDAEIGTNKGMLTHGGWIHELKQNTPKVIAVHRYGLNLSPDETMKRTLYHVKKLKTQDEVFLFWNNTMTTYEVKQIFEGNHLPDINADELLLYTCTGWNGGKRVFVILSQKQQ